LFGWTAMHHKIPTSDNLAARGMHLNQICPLCNAYPEDPHHLLAECAFTKGVLHHIGTWFHFHDALPLDSQDNATWITSGAATGMETHQRVSTGILLYCWWNIWKERNRMVFDSIQRNELQVALSTKEEIELYHQAFSGIPY
jgi:hypothetical protein